MLMLDLMPLHDWYWSGGWVWSAAGIVFILVIAYRLGRD